MNRFLRMGLMQLLAKTLRYSALFIGALLAIAQPAAAFETSATEAIVIDVETGDVLFEKDAGGKVTGLTLDQNGRLTKLTRTISQKK